MYIRLFYKKFPMGQSNAGYQIQNCLVSGFFRDSLYSPGGSAYAEWRICSANGYIIHFIKNIFKIIIELILICKKFSGSEARKLEWS